MATKRPKITWAGPVWIANPPFPPARCFLCDKDVAAGEQLVRVFTKDKQKQDQRGKTIHWECFDANYHELVQQMKKRLMLGGAHV